MKYIINICIPLLLLSILPVPATGADAPSHTEAGYPFIKNFSPREYGAGPSNWCVLQDKRGIMYFGNSEGILEYDGLAWRLIDVPKPSFVRSLSMDDKGRIYVAAVAELGYLEPDSNGTMVYRSLLTRLDEQHRKIGEVWDVLATPEGIFFKTRDYLLRLRDDQLKIFEVKGTFRIYRIGNDIYVRNDGVGLMKITGDSLRLIPGGGRFAKTGVYDMLPYPGPGNEQNQKILITTAADGLFLFDGKTVNRFNTAVDSLLIDSQLYHTALLANSSYAIATQRGGLIIINRNGDLLRILEESSGLKSQIIYFVYPDREGGLWLALSRGLARVEFPSPLSVFGENLGIKSTINTIYRYGDTLYIGDDFGISYLSESSV
ncbi:MAG: hypothetical protein WAN36_06605, partial [Calditrichia bacterium]